MSHRLPLFSYLRYDAETRPDSLEALGVSRLSAEGLVRTDVVEYLEEMCEFGRAISTRVAAAHFTRFV